MEFGWGYGHVAAGIAQLFVAFIAFSVFALVLGLLVRFLLVATRAAQLYVERHETRERQSYAPPPASDTRTRETPAAAQSAEPTAPVSDAAAPQASATQATPPATKPSTKPRTPKKPTA